MLMAPLVTVVRGVEVMVTVDFFLESLEIGYGGWDGTTVVVVVLGAATEEEEEARDEVAVVVSAVNGQ